MFVWRNLIKIFLKICSMPPVPIKNQLDNVPRLKDNKRKHLQKKLPSCSEGIDSN